MSAVYLLPLFLVLLMDLLNFVAEIVIHYLNVILLVLLLLQPHLFLTNLSLLLLILLRVSNLLSGVGIMPILTDIVVRFHRGIVECV